MQKVNYWKNGKIQSILSLNDNGTLQYFNGHGNRTQFHTRKNLNMHGPCIQINYREYKPTGWKWRK